MQKTHRVPLRVGILQTQSKGDAQQNWQKVVPLLEQAAKNNCNFVSLPEGGNCLARFASPKDLPFFANDPFVVNLPQYAKKLQMWIHLGSALGLDEKGLGRNRSMVFGPAGEYYQYDKIHMFKANLCENNYDESIVFTPGDTTVSFEALGWRFGLSICYDLRFSALYNALAQQKVEVFCIPAAFVDLTGARHWHVLTRARAIEHKCFVLAANQVGNHFAKRNTFGHSLVIDPWGEVLLDAGQESWQLSCVALDYDLLCKARKCLP